MQTLSGTYLRQDNTHYFLTIRSDSSFLYATTENLRSVDTIAFGKWMIDSKRFICLSSPEYLLNDLKISGTKSKNSFADTCYVIINAPRNKPNYPCDSLKKDIKYVVAALTVKSEILEQIETDEFSNVVKLYNPHRSKVLGIHIVIYSKRNTSAILTSDYQNEGLYLAKTKVYDPKAYAPNSLNENIFTVNIPDLTATYLNTRRLNKDYAKIIQSNEIEWDGHVYIKTNCQSSAYRYQSAYN